MVFLALVSEEPSILWHDMICLMHKAQPNPNRTASSTWNWTWTWTLKRRPSPIAGRHHRWCWRIAWWSAINWWPALSRVPEVCVCVSVRGGGEGCESAKSNSWRIWVAEYESSCSAAKQLQQFVRHLIRFSSWGRFDIHTYDIKKGID